MVDPLQNYENWLRVIQLEYPTTLKTKSFLRFDKSDFELFKSVVLSVSSLDPIAQSLALTQLAIHNGLKKKFLKQWLEQLKLEMQGGVK